MGTVGAILGTILLAVAAAIIVVFLFVPLAKIIAKVVGHIFATIGRWITDIFRLVGTVLVIPVFMVLTVLSVIIGRWSASAHYGRAVSGEFKSAGLCVYRIAIGHPLRLVGLHVLVEGFERRLPEVVAAAPGRDKPRGRKNQFDGYSVVGSLKGGGSGGKLYIAQPDELKNAAFVKRGVGEIDQVVIKTFSVHEGSTLPQIIRESRALDAAKRLGLILEHDLTNERFFYVMRYIPGEPLSIVTQRAHADADPEGLGDAALAKLLGYGRDVLTVLNRYHTGGLWHKDIKPDNIIVDHDQSEAHIVDLGLITPLRSAMTLTTHGTEYFRDPELVRMALKGVKVNEVNGEKFDIYAAAAVLYSAVEGSFPAHGGLSQITKRCPEAIRWIIRRGMTDYDKRYETVAEMLRDLDVVLTAEDAFAVKPAMLPSVGGAPVEPIAQPEAAEFVPPQPAPAPKQAARPKGDPDAKPKVRLANWWSGKYSVDDELDGVMADVDATIHEAMAEADAAINEAVESMAPRRSPRPQRDPTRRPAREQLRDARARAAERRKRAVTRVAERRRSLRTQRDKAAGLNPGAAIAIGCVVGLVSIPVSMLMLNREDVATGFADATEGLPGPIASHVRAHGQGQFAIAPPPPETPVPTVAVAPAAGEAVLVVSTFNQPVAPAIVDGVNQTVAELQTLGYHVADTTRDTSDAGLNLIADIRAARGIGSTKPVDAARQMRSWFDDADLDYDALVIIEPDPESLAKGDPFARVFIVDDDSASYERTLEKHAVARRVAEVIED